MLHVSVNMQIWVSFTLNQKSELRILYSLIHVCFTVNRIKRMILPETGQLRSNMFQQGFQNFLMATFKLELKHQVILGLKPIKLCLRSKPLESLYLNIHGNSCILLKLLISLYDSDLSLTTHIQTLSLSLSLSLRHIHIYSYILSHIHSYTMICKYVYIYFFHIYVG